MDAIIDKLQTLGELPDADKLLLKTVLSDVRPIAARKDILREGDRPTHVHLVASGWCCRYNIVAKGARQITAFLLPGDLCNSRITLLRQMDHSVGTVTSAEIVYIAPSQMDELLARPLIARALWMAGLVEESALRAWTVSLGKRDATERVAHLICELFVRLGTAGNARADGFDLPLTQELLGDALGLTTVHVNRVLRHLREAELVSFKNRTVEIADFSKLRKAAGFDPGYLQAIG
jgi:CRP-like cAMP-binding protein